MDDKMARCCCCLHSQLLGEIHYEENGCGSSRGGVDVGSLNSTYIVVLIFGNVCWQVGQ